MKTTNRQLIALTKRAAFSALLAGVLVIASSSANAVFLRGQPYTPANANFSMFALQGIDSSTPQGKSGFNPQVNGDFEFDGSIGVSYDTGGGKLTDFGLGLYANAAGQTQSTGMHIVYNAPVAASSITIRVEDFDIKVGDAFFNPQKVEPTILLLGANNTVYASATPQDIFPNLIPVSSTDKKAKGDVWDINFSGLLNTLHLADANITGFILAADMSAGEKPNSDPYLLISVGNGIPMVPEPGTYMAGLVAIGIAALFHVRQVRLKRKAAIKA